MPTTTLTPSVRLVRTSVTISRGQVISGPREAYPWEGESITAFRSQNPHFPHGFQVGQPDLDSTIQVLTAYHFERQTSGDNWERVAVIDWAAPDAFQPDATYQCCPAGSAPHTDEFNCDSCKGILEAALAELMG